MAHIIRSKRGRDLLVDDMHYTYNQNKSNKDGSVIYWECSQKKKQCLARLHTTSKTEGYGILKSIHEHNHAATQSRIEAKVALSELKENAKQSGLSTRPLISSCLSSLDNHGRAHLSNLDNMSRNVRRWRQRELKFPPIPSSRTGYDIPDQFKQLDNGAQFLQYDSGREDESRILIFATNDGLNDLKRYKNWSVDGTFKACPVNFYQLFTILVKIGNHSFPRLFALLPNKTEGCYMHLYSKVKELVELDPITVLSDYEKASINALTTVFPNVEHQGCLFHFSQSLYRKVVELGLRTRYHNDREFNLKIRCFNALAFLPPTDVIGGFEDLSEDEDVPEEFITYFEYTYIGIFRGRGATRKRTAPPYPISMWNVNARVQSPDILPRSNNSHEAFNKAMTNTLPRIHPSIWQLIATLKKEEAIAQTKRTHFERGDSKKTTKKYTTINDKITSVLNRYNSDDKVEFLKSIAQNLHSF